MSTWLLVFGDWQIPSFLRSLFVCSSVFFLMGVTLYSMFQSFCFHFISQREFSTFMALDDTFVLTWIFFHTSWTSSLHCDTHFHLPYGCPSTPWSLSPVFRFIFIFFLDKLCAFLPFFFFCPLLFFSPIFSDKNSCRYFWHFCFSFCHHLQYLVCHVISCFIIALFLLWHVFYFNFKCLHIINKFFCSFNYPFNKYLIKDEPVQHVLFSNEEGAYDTCIKTPQC